MDQWIKDGLASMAGTPSVDAAALVVSLGLSFVLSFILAKTYVHTHSGYSYSKSFVHTIVFVAITIDLIMLIIGSNIARAFALVGAMSIVRFRNPIKDSRDLIFLFMSMAVGMATGTQFYFFAIAFTAFAVLALLAFHHTGFGDPARESMILRLRGPESLLPEIERVCAEICRTTTIIAIDKSGDPQRTQEVVLEVELSRGQSQKTLLQSLAGLSNEMSVNVLVGESSVSV